MYEVIFDQLLPWLPVTWKRPRVAVRGTMSGVRLQIINEKKYKQAKSNLGWELKAAAPALRCSSTDRFGFRAGYHLQCARGGDGDRYENLIMDALQGIVWENDNQVDEGQWVKTYCSSSPGLWLTIWRI